MLSQRKFQPCWVTHWEEPERLQMNKKKIEGLTAQ
jgi:hypothetical protein